jgi:hypothetical protein
VGDEVEIEPRYVHAERVAGRATDLTLAAQVVNS